MSLLRRKTDVLFLIEHIDREMEIVQKIAGHLKNHKVESEILSIKFHLHQLYFVQPKIIVLPYMSSKMDRGTLLSRKIFGDSVTYMCLNWEQLLFKFNMQYKKPRDSFVKEYAKHIAWDESFKRNFLIKFGVKEDSIEIVGFPQREILEKEFTRSDLHRKTLGERHGISSSKKWIFMPLNYSWSFSSDRIVEAKIKKGFNPDIAWKYREYSIQARNKFIHFASELSNNDDYEIILRPHPSISEYDYEQCFKGLNLKINSNIHIIKDATVRQWIPASDYVLSSWSTAAWDSYQCGVPSFLFQPEKMPDWMQVDFVDKLPHVTSVADFEKKKDSIKPEIVTDENLSFSHNVSVFLNSLVKENDTPFKTSFYIDYEHFKYIAKRFIASKFFRGVPKFQGLTKDYFKPIRFEN